MILKTAWIYEKKAHPELSILMPLSVGVESQCEIAEFTLAQGCEIPVEEIANRMNPFLPTGLRALASYDGGQKAGKLAWLRARLVLDYDAAAAIPVGQEPDRIEALQTLFALPELIVEKHSKKGNTEMDIAPMIQEIQVGTNGPDSPSCLVIEALVAAQNPTLNPLLLITAVERYLPDHRPDHVLCRRIEIYDAQMEPFR